MKKYLSLVVFLITLMLLPLPVLAQTPLAELDWVTLPGAVERRISLGELIERNDHIVLDIGVTPGEYLIAMSFMPAEPILARRSIMIEVGGFATQAQIMSVWADETKDYAVDRFGNEILPPQVARDTYHIDFLICNSSLSRFPIVFQLDESSQLAISSLDVMFYLDAIYILTPPVIPYFDETPGASAPFGRDIIIIEGQDHVAKSQSYIGSMNEQNPRVHPYELGRRLINVAHSHRVGDKLVYEFYVETSGRYQISFRYNQWAFSEMEVYRNLFVNGQIPSQEFIGLPFTFTGLWGNFANFTADSYLYLEAGWNTIALQADATILQPYYDRIRYILDSLNQISTELRRLLGVAGAAHRHRTWAVEQYIPGITQRLTGYSEELLAIFDEFPRLSERDPAPLTVLRVSAGELERLVQRIDRLPANMEWINDVTLILADLINGFYYQPLIIDRIYIHPPGFELAPARMGFFASLWQIIREFFHALFFAEDEFSVTGRQDDEELVVWVARSIQYVELMQRMVDTRFTPETGQRVRLSIMPSEQRLILSNASGTNPDAAVGIMSHIPFEFALRGAVADLTQFPDFIPFVEDNFEPATFQAFVFEDGIYGLTETKNFQILFYRTDILERLNLSPPDTWDDVRHMMPVLRRNAMNFFIPLSQGVGFKPFFATAPFFFQMEADLYTADGMATALHTPNSLAAFELMTDLYRIYSLQDNIPSFYQNFRLGIIPVGVSDLNQLIQFRIAAPEIYGHWNIAPSPGVMGEDGVVRRYQLTASSASIIMSSSQKQQEAWEFLRWWMSAETQIEFGYTLITMFGPEFVWGSANLHAFASLPFTAREQEVILEQWRWAREVPRHPASYIVEREISNAWFATVGDGTPPRIALDRSMAVANREITRRLEEFGYVQNGVPVRDFVIRPIESFLSEEFLERRASR